ncbi:hypothetical protein G3N57_00735 [Paraburkholderia sp. Se-20369]|nr:hypothetical protein [Paraburkholderia sp. Se-20369]
MARKFKRGQAVMYFEGETGKRCYFGGKMGAYRVLSSIPNVESGWAIPLSAVDRAVFPAPSEDRTFDRAVCEAIQYRVDRTFYVQLEYVQAGPHAWAVGYSLRIGDTRKVLPVAADRTFPTFEEAITAGLSPLLHELTRLAAGVGNAFVDVGSITATVRRHAKDTIYHLLSTLPAHVQDDIVMSLLGESGDQDG